MTRDESLDCVGGMLEQGPLGKAFLGKFWLSFCCALSRGCEVGQSPLTIVMGYRENHESQTIWFETVECAHLEIYKYVIVK